MEQAETADSFLLTQFREFYQEVLRLKQLIAWSGSDRSRFSSTAAEGSSSSKRHANTVADQLHTLLENQAMRASRTGGAFAYEVYREAQYVMAALADETFLNLSWDGQDSWPLLESTLFQTHYAGEEIFARIERLLQRRDPFYVDLAGVYYMALSLGFQGKYRGVESSQLPVYQRQLFAMIYRSAPRLFSAQSALMPQAYRHTLDQIAPRKLADSRVWFGLAAGVVLLWLLVSQVAWSVLSADVACLICQVSRGTACSCSVETAK